MQRRDQNDHPIAGQSQNTGDPTSQSEQRTANGKKNSHRHSQSEHEKSVELACSSTNFLTSPLLAINEVDNLSNGHIELVRNRFPDFDVEVEKAGDSLSLDDGHAV